MRSILLVALLSLAPNALLVARAQATPLKNEGDAGGNNEAAHNAGNNQGDAEGNNEGDAA